MVRPCRRHDDGDISDELRRDDDDFRLLCHLRVVVRGLQDVQPRNIHRHCVQILHHHPVVDLDGVGHVGCLRRDLRNPLLKVEDVDGELVRVRTRCPEQLGAVLHEGLVRLQR